MVQSSGVKCWGVLDVWGCSLVPKERTSDRMLYPQEVYIYLAIYIYIYIFMYIHGLGGSAITKMGHPTHQPSKPLEHIKPGWMNHLSKRQIPRHPFTSTTNAFKAWETDTLKKILIFTTHISTLSASSSGSRPFPSRTSGFWPAGVLPPS